LTKILEEAGDKRAEKGQKLLKELSNGGRSTVPCEEERLRGEVEANQQPREPGFLRFARNRLRNPYGKTFMIVCEIASVVPPSQ